MQYSILKYVYKYQMLKLLSIDLYFRKSGSGNINLLNMLSKIESANSKNNAGYYAETTSTIPPFRYVLL